MQAAHTKTGGSSAHLLIVLSVLAVLSFAGQAKAAIFTLGDLIDSQGSFQSDNSKLTFSNFDVTITGSLSSDTSDYSISSRTAGLRLTGDLTKEGTIRLSYDIEVVEGAVHGASISLTGFIGIPGGEFLIRDSFFEAEDGPALLATSGEKATLLVGSTASSTIVSDDVDFATPRTFYHVVKEIQISAGTIDQDNDWQPEVPEPATGALFALAAAGAFRRYRRRRN